MLYSVKIYLLILGFFFTLLSCKSGGNKNKETKSKIEKTTHPTNPLIKRENREILIQPFSDLPIEKSQYVYKKVKEIWINTKLLPAIKLPSEAYYEPRNRYRADTLIHWLKKSVGISQVIAGVTSKDISTTKGVHLDYGVMGLGFMNGPACMISTYRLKKGSNEQLFKTVIHELGHNFGLQHCPEKTCYMRDAMGRNSLDEENEFCYSCRRDLLAKGWKL